MKRKIKDMPDKSDLLVILVGAVLLALVAFSTITNIKAVQKDVKYCAELGGIWIDADGMEGLCLNSNAALFKEGDA